MSHSSPIRVLHVLGSLDIGGVERWLLACVKAMDRDRFQLSIMVHRRRPGILEPEFRECGVDIVRCPGPRPLHSYSRRFLHILRLEGGYDIVHSHVHLFSGYVVLLAQLAGVRARIAHAHSDTSRQETAWSPARRIYAALMRRLLRHSANGRIAASCEAGRALFGADARWSVHYCGLDLAACASLEYESGLRQRLGLRSKALIAGHVGRFTAEKNQARCVDILHALRRAGVNANLVFVGDGPLRKDVERYVRSKGLDGYVSFLGWRHDVHVLMQSAFDVMLLPSLREGLPLVAVEAQATGLPVVMSDSITSEAVLIPHLVQRLSVDAAAELWAQTCSAAVAARRKDEDDCRAVLDSPFNIVTSTRLLQEYYESAVQSHRRPITQGATAR